MQQGFIFFHHRSVFPVVLLQKSRDLPFSRNFFALFLFRLHFYLPGSKVFFRLRNLSRSIKRKKKKSNLHNYKESKKKISFPSYFPMSFPLSLQPRHFPTQSNLSSLPFDSPNYHFSLEDSHCSTDFPRSFEDTHIKSKPFEEHANHMTTFNQMSFNEMLANKMGHSKQRPSEEGHSFNEIPKPKATDDNHSLLKYLVLENFKVSPCSIKVQHNHKQCQFYHYPKDRKRVGDFYSAELCEYTENNQSCPQGDKCLKSHSCVEQLYRADKYKTKFCSQYPYNTDNCEYGEFCSFAHHEEEILIELLHRLEKNDDFFMFKFKTVMCPFSSLPHDKAQCVYSHNWQDFRRKPNLFNYTPVSCSNWKFNNYIVNYSDGCPMSGTCDKCHGWKELDYHPLVYKTKPCANGVNCHRTFECPFYHCDAEKRFLY